MRKDKISYQDFLKFQLEKRCQRNPSYGLRSFARDLDLSASGLSEVLNKKRGLSENKAKKIIKKLTSDPEEIKFFIDSVCAQHSRSQSKRILAKRRVNEYNDNKRISLNAFNAIYDWYHFVLLELFYLKNFNPKIKWMAKKIGIRPFLVERAIKRLTKVGLLRDKPKLYPVNDFDYTTSDVPSDGLKKHHFQMIDKAQKAIYEQNIDERDISSITFATSTSKLKEMKKFIKNMRREFDKKFGNHLDKPDAIYNLNIQLFRLDYKERGE